jgi:hypothetical protein
MPRSSRDADEIVRLCAETIGENVAVHARPSIPPEKEKNARAAHRRHLPESEPILVLCDSTLLGSGDDGFLLTTERLCWKNLWAHPRQIPWGEVDPARVEPDGGAVAIAGGRISLWPELASAAALLIRRVAARPSAAETGPYRGATEASSDVARLVALARRTLGEVHDVYFDPSIPPKKLGSARAVHAGHLPADETVAILYDDTAFGGAREGFVITARRLCWKNGAGEPRQAEWEAIDPAAIAPGKNYVRVGGAEIDLTARDELAGPVAALLTAIARERMAR